MRSSKIIMVVIACIVLASCFPWKEDRYSTVIEKRYDTMHEWSERHARHMGKSAVFFVTDYYWIESRWFVTLEQRIQEGDAKVKTGKREYEISRDQYHALENGRTVIPADLDKRQTWRHSGHIPAGTVAVQE